MYASTQVGISPTLPINFYHAWYKINKIKISKFVVTLGMI